MIRIQEMTKREAELIGDLMDALTNYFIEISENKNRQFALAEISRKMRGAIEEPEEAPGNDD